MRDTDTSLIKKLERIIGSQTLFSYLKFAFTFKQLDGLCIALGLLWIMSPLGGQGILRMLSTRQEMKTSSETILYFDLYVESPFMPGNSDYYHTKVNGIYLASLFAPADISEGATDSWGGIKIPSIDSLDFDHQGDDGVVVTGSSGYASLLGVPVNTTTCANASDCIFTMNTTTFTAQCEGPKIFGADFMRAPNNGAPFILESPAHLRGDNMTSTNISMITFVMDPSGLVAASKIVMHNCTLTPNSLSAKVECYSNDCRATRIKKIDDPDGQFARSMFPPATWLEIANRLPASTGYLPEWTNTQTERYIYDPHNSLIDDRTSSVDLSGIPIEEFSKRFTTILNTYYQATISPSTRLGTLIPDIFDPNSLVHNTKPVRNTTATAHTISSTIYQRHWEWVIFGLVASIAMLAVAITGISLNRLVTAPDIYGYVSSMTRDNPYFPVPPNGCTLDGAHRATLLRDVTVRLEDVAPDKDVGHLAFTIAGYKTPTEQLVNFRLRRTKLYS
jgi:hypothetical protein